jgi:hypothetical protein
VGAPGDLGAAYIFRREKGDDSAVWRELVILSSSEARSGFGRGVGISGDTAVVSENTGPTTSFGEVFSQDEGGRDRWGLVRRFSITGSTFLGDVAIEGQTAVFGAGEIQAFARILGRDVGGPNAWGQEAIYGSFPQEVACCGTFRSVEISGNQIILGLSGNGTGVHIAARNEGGLNAWNGIARLRDPLGNTSARTNLGTGVSIDDDTALLGSPGRFNNPPVADDNAVFVLVSDLDGDGIRDGLDPCPRDPRNNVAGMCQRASAKHPVLDDLITQGDVTTQTDGRRHVITATHTNTSTTTVKNPFFEVTELTGANLLLNADGGRGGVGATLSPDVGNGLLSPGESMTVSFEIRLLPQKPLRFRVTLHGDPIASRAALVIDGNGILTGATGVVVNGRLYDVEFVDGTCAEVFNGCALGTLNFPFEGHLALPASQALLNQVFGDGTQLFDSNPSLTNGCSSVFSCSVITPHSRSATGVSVAQAINHSSMPLEGGSPNADEALFSADIPLNYDSALDISGTFARWTLRQP